MVLIRVLDLSFYSEYLNHPSKEVTCISLKIKKPGTVVTVSSFFFFVVTVSNVPRLEFGYILPLHEPPKLPNIKTSIIFNPVILLILYLFKGTLRIIGALYILVSKSRAKKDTTKGNR